MNKHKAIPKGYMTVGEVAKKMDVKHTDYNMHVCVSFNINKKRTFYIPKCKRFLQLMIL